jgi:folate-dependent tRNA-U54 methylase TrmFO/GidA
LKKNNWLRGFARLRDQNLVGDAVNSESEYIKLQKKVRTAEYKVHYWDLDKVLNDTDFSKVDTVHMSNIGYESKNVCPIAAQFLQKGAKRVICAWQVFGNESYYNSLTPGTIINHNNLNLKVLAKGDALPPVNVPMAVFEVRAENNPRLFRPVK